MAKIPRVERRPSCPKKWLRILDVPESDAKRLLAAITERLSGAP